MTATPDGFEFFIQMRDEFSGVASKVAQSIEQLSTEIRQLREAQNQLAEASRKSRREAKKQADTAKETAKAKKKDADASKKLSKEEQRHFDALQKIEKAQEEVATQEKVVAESKDINRLATRKKLRVLTQEQEGLLAARAAVRSKLAEDRKIIAVARAEEAASKKKTRQLAVEAEAQQRVARAKRRAAVEARTLQIAEEQGIDPRTGRARVADVPEDVRIEQEARRKFEKELQALKIRNQQEIFRRQSEEFQRLKAEQKVARTTPRAPQAAALTAQQRAQIRLNRDIEAAQTRLELERLRKLNPQYQQLQREVGKLDQRKRGLLDTMKNLNNRTNRVSFTFRRLFGILAAFTAARAAIGGFNELVRGSITFNSTLEQAQLGIRSILVAVGGVTDTFGNAVDKVEQFQRATAVANDQIQKLRVDAQRTAATFEQLVTTFQVAIAPGITAGLDIDQIREFTIRISQAAGALGVQQNQLVEEIRSVLEGTIQKRTTRIASALGITNQDIERAKELGVLSDFLQDRFQAFALAGEEALGTFSAVLTNTVDAFKLLVGTAGEGYFEAIKDLLNEIRGAATSEIDGAITPNPAAVAIVEQIFNGLEAVVQQARSLREALDFKQLQSIATALGNAISFIGSGLLGAVEGVIRAVDRLRSIAALTFSLFSDASDIAGFNEEFRKLVARNVDLVATWGALTAVIGVALKLLKSVVVTAEILWAVMGAGPAVLSLIRRGVIALRAPMATLAALATVPQLSFIAIAAILYGIVEGTRAWYKENENVNLSLESSAKILWERIYQISDLIISTVVFVLDTVGRLIITAFNGVVVLVTNTLLRPFEELLFLLGEVSETAQGLAETLKTFRENSEKDIADSANYLAEPFEKLKRNIDGALEGYDKGVKKIVEENAGPGIIERLTKGISDALNKFSLPDVELPGAERAESAVRNLRDVFEQFTGLIGKANADLEVSAEKLKELQDESRAVGLELTQAVGGDAVTSQAQRIIKEVSQSRIQSANILFEIENKILNNEKLKAALLQRSQTAANRFKVLRKDEQKIIEDISSKLEVFNSLQSQQIRLTNEAKLSELALDKAKRDGNTALIKELEERLKKEQESLLLSKQYTDEILRSVDEIQLNALQSGNQQLVEILQEMVTLQAQTNLAQREGEQLAKGKQAAESLINEILTKRLSVLREESAFAIEQARIASEKALQIARIESLSEQLVDSEFQQVAQATARTLQAKEELRVLETRAAQDIRSLRLKQEQANTDQARALIEEQILALQKQQALEAQAVQLSVQSATERLVQAREAFNINNILEQQQVIQTRLEAGAQRLVNLAEESRSQAALSFAERVREVAQTRIQIQLSQQENQLRLEAAQRRLVALRNQEGSALLVAAAERDIVALKQQQSAEQEKLNASLDAAAIKLERARRVLEGTFTQGLQDGLRQWANNLPTEFERGVQVMTGIAQNFSTFLSTLIVDAFDPTQDVDLEQRLGQFFQGVAQIASQSFIEGLFQELLAQEVTGIGIEAVAPSLIDQATQASQILIDANSRIAATVGETAPQIVSAFSDGVTTLADSAANTLGSVVQSAQQAATGLGEAFSGLAGPVGTLAAAGTTFTSSVVPGLNTAAGALLAAAKALTVAAAKAAAAGVVTTTTGGSAIGSASGGAVPSRIAARHSGRPRSHASRGVRGFASGGRPSWVPLSDTIPAWLTPGEWVMRLGAVRSYGENVMDAINSGMIDPNALRALAASARGRRVRKPSYPAFAEGGLATSEQYQRSQVATDAAGPTARASTPPVLAMDNRLMDQFLASGSSGMLRWMRDNKNSIRAAISDERGTR